MNLHTGGRGAEDDIRPGDDLAFVAIARAQRVDGQAGDTISDRGEQDCPMPHFPHAIPE